METVSYRCPNCGAGLALDPGSGWLYCDSCGSFHKPEDIGAKVEARQEEKQLREEVNKQEHKMIRYDEDEADTFETSIYLCSSCGAELMSGDVEVASFCSFCGQPGVAFDRVSREVKPQKIIPFKLTKEQALARIKDRLTYCPELMPDEILNIDVDMIRGIYMPYWIYNCKMEKTTKIMKYDQESHSMREVNSLFLTRTYDITMDASRRLNDTLADWLDPFDTKAMVDFDAAYLSGYYADKYDVSSSEMDHRAQGKASDCMTNEVLNRFPKVKQDLKVGNQTNSRTLYELKSENEKYDVNEVNYAMFPVYFVTLKNKNKPLLLLVNGQTGRVVSNIPIDENKAKKAATKYTVIYSVVYALILILAMLAGNNNSKFYCFCIFPPVIALAVANSSKHGKEKYEDAMRKLDAPGMKAILRDRGN